MFGRFRKCLKVVFAISLCAAPLFAGDYNEIYVNGHLMVDLDSDGRLGLRSKAWGDRYLGLGNYYQAIQYYESAAVYLPTEADIYFNLGNCYYFLGSSASTSSKKGIYNMAIEYFNKAIEIYEYPENAEKSRENYYLALIRKCFSLSKVYPTYTEANKMKVDEIIPIESKIYKNHLDISDELDELYALLHVGWVENYVPKD